MGVSVDPDLRGGRSSLLLRLLDEAPRVDDFETIAKWRLSKTSVTTHIETDLQSISTIDKEIEVLVKAKAIAPQLQQNLETEIMRKKTQREEWKLVILKGVVFNKIEEMKRLEQRELKLKVEVEETKAQIGVLKRKADEREGIVCSKLQEIESLEQIERNLKVGVEGKEKEIGILKKKAEEREVTIQCFEKLVKENWNAIREKDLEMERKLEEKDLEMERKLGEKDLEMDRTRKKDEADKLQMEGKHRLKCNNLRLKAERAEGLLTSFSKEVFLESFKTALQDTVYKSGQLGKELSDAHLRSEEGTRLARGARNKSRSCSAKLDGNMKPETEPQDRGDLIQTEKNLEKQQVPSKRLRDGGRNAAPNVSLRSRKVMNINLLACEKKENGQR